MIPTRRLLAGAAAAAVCVLVASGCDTSPVAASVNSHEIKQTALNAELHAVASNKGFVTAFDGTQANETAGLAVVGDAKGTYNAKFVANILTEVVQSSIIQQYLAAHHRLPSAAVVAAVGGFDAASYRSIWLGFPASYRAQLTQRDADLSQLVPVSAETSTLRAAASEAAPYLYSTVCVRAVGVSVDDAAGQVDFPASLRQAQSLLQRRDLGGGGVVSCYTPDQLEAQGPRMDQTVLSLGVGRATAPVKTSFGYQLYAVTRRVQLPFDHALEQAASLALARQNGLDDQALTKILRRGRVTVNPQYGTWDAAQLSVVPSTTLDANGTQSGAS